MYEKFNDTKYTTQKTKDQATRTPLKTGGDLMCSGRVNCFCYTSDTRRVSLFSDKNINDVLLMI